VRRRVSPVDAHASLADTRGAARRIADVRPLPGHAAPFLLALTLAAAPAWGQRLGGLRDSFATLPESNDALVLTSRLAEAVEAGEYRVAIELAEQMMALPPGLVGAPASRTFYPVRRHAIRLLRRFPPEAVRAYRQIYDAKVEALLARAREASDEAALESLFWSYPLSTHWSDVGLELAARRIDRGAFDEAVSILAEMSAGATSPDPRVEMQLAAALEASGAASAARAVLERLAARDMGGDALLAGRLRELQRWFALRRAEDPQAVHAYAPRLLIGPAWSVALGPAGNGAPPFSAEALIEAALDERRTPLQDPVLAGRTLLVRLRGAVWAIDASTLAILWTRREYKAEGVTFASGRFLDGVSPDEDGRPAEVRALLQSWLAHVISADEARVYTVEGLPDGAQLDDAGPWGRQFGAPRIGVGNELVARDLKTGATVWRTGAMRDHPLFGVEFQDRPVALDGRLLAPIRRENELKLVAIAPATGELLHEQVVLGLPTALPEERGNSQIAADDAGVYVVSGTGVTAAWDRDSLAWRWATVYPSALAEQLGRLWWQQARGQHSVRYDRPVLVGDLLIAAPPDSDEILAFDRFDGEQRWSLPRKEYPLVIGACEAGLVLANQVLVCLDADDPRGVPPKWRSVPLALTGRPAIRGERIFAPTRDGLVVVDARTGRVIVDQASGAAAQGYAGGGARGAPRLSQLYSSAAAGLAVSTIVCGPQATFAVSPLGVVKYPDVEATQRRAAHENAERDWLELAWLDLIAGDLDAALACVQQVSTAALDEPAQAASRRLLLEIYVAKANAVEDVEQRLRWLRRAAELPVDAPVAARLRTWIGSELESLGRWEECIEHYARLVLAGEDALVARSADSRHRTAEWAYAADRLGAALREASEATAAGAADDLLAGAGDRPDALLRVRRALRDRPERRRVDETLLLSRIAPELAELVLVPDDPGQPLLRRRQLHIARWYTYVSLAMLPEAREAAALWENELGRDLPVAGEEALDELSAERLASLELALRKISSLGGAAFTPALDRVWRVKGGELLLDPRDERLTRNWIPIRAFEKPFLQLIEITKNEFPWRQVDDGLSRSIAPRALLVEETHRALYGRERGAPQRSAWPLARHRALAAAPVRGGLVCFGLGPERYGGARLWEAAAEEWSEIPLDGERRISASAYGVVSAERADLIRLRSWFDGGVLWERELPGARVVRVVAESESVVVMTEDAQAFVFDARDGTKREGLPDPFESAQELLVVADTIVVWTGQRAVAFDVDTLAPRWERECGPVRAAFAATAQGLCVYRERGRGWQLVRALDGSPLLPASLTDVGTLSAVWIEADTLFAAGLVDEQDGAPRDDFVRLAAFDTRTGGERWRRDLKTQVPLNVSQLSGHPQFIPVLLDVDESDRAADPTVFPAIQLIRRSDGGIEPITARGETSPQMSIREDYARGAGACGMYMLVSSHRIIVQVSENLIAYGASRLRSGE